MNAPIKHVKAVSLSEEDAVDTMGHLLNSLSQYIRQKFELLDVIAELEQQIEGYRRTIAGFEIARQESGR